MKIGIDIDGVLTDVEKYAIDYISKWCVENNIEYNIREINYQFNKTFNISEKQEDDFWYKNIESYGINISIRPFASEVIKRLKEEGHEIYIITARFLSNREDEIGERMRNIVRNWLNKNEIDYDKLIFSRRSKERKVQEIIDNRIDLMIEDSPNNIKQISQIIPVICYHAQYNKDCIGDKMIRCYSWYDVYKKINTIFR